MSKQEMLAKILKLLYGYDNKGLYEGYIKMIHPNTRRRLYIGPKGGIKRGQYLADSKYDSYLSYRLLRDWANYKYDQE